jgi:hypothetical protein
MLRNIRQSDRFILKLLLRQTAFHLNMDIKITRFLAYLEHARWIVESVAEPSVPPIQKNKHLPLVIRKMHILKLRTQSPRSGHLKSDTKQTKIKEKE